MPPYRLQTLLEMRERAEEEAKQAFAEAMKACEAEKRKLADLVADLERRKAERKGKIQAYMAEIMKKGANPGSMTQINRFEARLKDEEAQVALEIDRQKEVVVEAEKLVEQRRLEMADAAKEKKAIEKHKENWMKQVKYERQQKEDMSTEEIGNTLHLQRQRQRNKA
jgi:flagellar export protein FliJ